MIGIGKSAYLSVLIAESELTVGNLALVNILTSVPGNYYQAVLKNVSPAAQTIRVGMAPSYAGGAVKGVLLAVNDALVLDLFSHDLNAIASAAGGLLDVLIYSS